jgi:hypothetical protein
LHPKQNSAKILSCLPEALEKSLQVSIQGTKPDTDAIKAAVMRQEEVAGAYVQRGYHLRVV